MPADKRLAPVLEFARFRLDPQRRELLCDGRVVELGGRLFDLLAVLVDARGTVVSKDDLLRLAWPGRIVDENNLQAGISALRKALGADRNAIRTVSGRGYQFTSDVRECAPVPAAGPLTNLPAPMSLLIGRDSALSELRTLVMQRRLVTLTGAGGIGKTRLAIDVARSLLPSFPQGVWLVDLAPLSHDELVPATVALALRLHISDMSPTELKRALNPQHTLVVLDNCEHLINAAAIMASELMSAGSNVFVICTSREPLRVDNEWIYQVQPLDTPAEGASSEDELLATGAAQLFVLRASAAQPSFRVDAGIVARLGFICRRLDGLPLAIELAAARAAALGVAEVAARLDQRFRLLTGGRRSALPRHQTLRATFDWSYELLTEIEREVLCRLGVFVGEFTLDAASAVLSMPGNVSGEIAAYVALLVEKSLIAVRLTGDIVRFRLLETTREYALEKLAQRAEATQYARQHATYFLSVFQRASIEWLTGAGAEWSSNYRDSLDDARAALDWTYSAEGEQALGVDLTIALVPVWLRLSSVAEWVARTKQALRALTSKPESDPRHEMQLRAALGHALLLSKGIEAEGESETRRALLLAEQLGDIEYQLVALNGLYGRTSSPGFSFRALLSLAEQFSRIAKLREAASSLNWADALMANAHLFMGDLDAATRHLAAASGREIMSVQRLPIIEFDERSNELLRAHTLWLRGFPEQSLRLVTTVITDFKKLSHAVTACWQLGMVVAPIALLSGDLGTLEECLVLLAEQQQTARLFIVDLWIGGFQGARLVKRGDHDLGVQALRKWFAHRHIGVVNNDALLTAALAEGLVETGQTTNALTLLDDALREADTTDVRWYVAEFLRLKGELLLRIASPTADVNAEACYSQALECARRQGALAWELRAAMSLARLRLRQGRAPEALNILQPVYARFSEGFEMVDLVTARALLASLKVAPTDASTRN